MSGAVSAQLGIGTVGAKISLVPCNHFATTGAPFSSVGVWQSEQPATPFTKYSPWAICCLPAVLAGAARLLYAATRYKAAMAIAIITLFKLSPRLFWPCFWSHHRS